MLLLHVILLFNFVHILAIFIYLFIICAPALPLVSDPFPTGSLNLGSGRCSRPDPEAE